MSSPEARCWLRACALVAACGLTPASGSLADDLHPRGAAGVTVYSESMDTSIVSTHANVGLRLPHELELDAAWSADIISSASVDVVTAATDRIDERRNQGGITLGRESVLPDLDLDAGYTFSIERDSYAHVGHVGARQGFLEDNLAISLDYGISYNRLGLRDEAMSRWRPLWVHTLDLGLTYILNPRTQVELIYSGGLSRGYHSSRYRRVPITFRQDLRATDWVDEVEPDTRQRNAFTLRGEHAFGDRFIASADYRFYWDTWGVTGHTLRLGTSVELPGHVTLSLQARGSQQSGASFYQRIYSYPTAYRTRDRRLSPHLSGMAGAAIAWNLGSYVHLDTLELRASVDGVIYTFNDYAVPQLDSLGGAPWTTLGDVTGLIIHVEVGVRR